MAELSHIHGIEFDPSDGSALLATHHGVFRFKPGDLAVLISPDRADYMAFILTSAGAAIASGHPESGGNIGVITSPDFGVTWTKLSDGADGPVDFHAIADASNDPAILIGLYQGGIQASTDGGKTWAWSEDAPSETRLVAVTQDSAVLESMDGGGSWSPLE